MEAGVSEAAPAMSSPPIPRDVQCLAIICPSWVGDTVMATPVFRAARAARPKARLIGIMRRGLNEVLAGTPWFDEMINCEMKGVLGPIRLGKVLRQCGAEAILLLPNSFRSALGARLSSAAIRVGYDRDGRGWLLTHGKMAPRIHLPVAMIEYYAALAEFALGLPSIDTWPELATTPAERVAAEAILKDVPRPFIVLNPGGNKPAKRWPPERFAAVADALAKSDHLAAVVSGSPGEMEVLRAVTKSAKSSIINLAERGVSLGSLKAVLEQAKLLITNDTGPRHLAAALGTPLITLFGPTDHRWTTLNCPHERIVLAEPFLPEELVADRHAKRARSIALP